MSDQPGGTVGDRDRCPSCGARVGPTQPWCTLCHARLDGGEAATISSGGTDRTDPTRVTGVTGQPDQAGQPDQVDEVDEADERDGAGESAGRDPVAGAPATLPPGAAEAMLAELAASTAAGRPLARGPLAGRSRGVRTALAVGAAIVLTALGVGLLSLVGLLL